MNKYGYFVYEDYPLNAVATVTTNYRVQEESKPITVLDRLVDRYYHNWATFEPNEFDFEKFIFTYDPEAKMANTSVIVSDENGCFASEMTITIIPQEAYSGSGIALCTYNTDYTIKIVVTDVDGIRTFNYEKTEDEFYPIIFNGLQSVKITFLRVEPYHSLKVIAYQLGRIRILQESDLVEEPVITNHFSLKGEELEYDTLELVIRGNKEEFNVVAGERITYSRTGQSFYVDTGVQNNDSTISISCYDEMARLEHNITGIMRNNQNVSNFLTTEVLNRNNVNVIIQDTLVDNQTFSGTLEPMTFREAAQITMQGNCLRLKRIDDELIVFCPSKNENIAVSFNDNNIVSVPEFEQEGSIHSIHFLKHYYTINRKDGKVEVFNGLVDRNTRSRIYYSEPISSVSYYYVSGTNADGEDILTAVSANRFTVLASGAYYSDIRTDYTQRIVVVGYPYNESNYAIDVTNENIPSVFKNNEISITDCTVVMDLNEYTQFKQFLLYSYGFNKIISFESPMEANAGDFVEIDTNDSRILAAQHFVGWVITKQDNANGVYKYEVACR